MTTMTLAFVDHQQEAHEFAVAAVGQVMEQLIDRQRFPDGSASAAEFPLTKQLIHLLRPFTEWYEVDAEEIAHTFSSQEWSMLIHACERDALRYQDEDPALECLEEVFYASNGFWATVAYRIAHALYQLQVPILPRTISGYAHSRTGVDIHPATTIAPGLFIDHGTGIAIGCTGILGERVNLYNGVVLGTRSKPTKKTDEKSGVTRKRHPTIGNGVSLYTNAFVGGDITIGEGSVIGAYAFVTQDVPPGSVVMGKPLTSQPPLS